MSFRWVADDLVVVIDHRDLLDDGDFEALLQSLAERNVAAPGFRMLVDSVVGGGPGAAQRARFDRQLPGKPMRIAVLCSSAFTRVIIKAFQRLGFSQMAPFAPDQEEGAFRHLGLRAPAAARVREALAKLRALGGRRPAAAGG